MKVPYPMAKGNGSTETYKQMATLATMSWHSQRGFLLICHWQADIPEYLNMGIFIFNKYTQFKSVYFGVV